MYVSLLVFEMALLTLFMGVGLKQPQILTLYMLGWKGLVLGIPKCIICWCRTCVDLFRLDFELGVVVGWWSGLSKNLGLNNFSLHKVLSP